MFTRLLLVGAVLVQCWAAPSSSDLQTEETKWKGHHGGGWGPGPGFAGRGLYGAWGGGGWPGFGRFDGGYGPGFYNEPLAFAPGGFPGPADPWGLGYGGFGPWIY